MGQSVNPNGAIFLSAGIPDPAAKHFVREADSAAISAAISGLLYVVLGRRRLVWGGHPAITPIVWAFCDAMNVDYGAWVKLYQSSIFADEFPAETVKFNNVVITPEVTNDVPASLAVMRERMLAETDFSAAVFLGGMKGIFDEFELFKKMTPAAMILPIISTGGAAAVLGEQLGVGAEFARQRDYIALFHRQLGIDPNEMRYASPVDQPRELHERIVHPAQRKEKHSDNGGSV